MQTPSTGLQYSFLEHCHNWLGGGGGGYVGMQTPSTSLQYSFLEHCRNWLRHGSPKPVS